jgi:hypothetical protein
LKNFNHIKRRLDFEKFTNIIQQVIDHYSYQGPKVYRKWFRSFREQIFNEILNLYHEDRDFNYEDWWNFLDENLNDKLLEIYNQLKIENQSEKLVRNPKKINFRN